MNNIHLIAIKRLLLGWLAASILVLGGVYAYNSYQISEKVIALAQTEIARVTPSVLAHINGEANDLAILKTMTEQYNVPGFLVIELYDRAGKMVVQKSGPQAKEIESLLDAEGIHPLPHGNSPLAYPMRIGSTEVIRVLAPLRNGDRLEGHFEGIYVVPAEKLTALEEESWHLLLTVFATILLTTLLLYPFIISLNRRVHREAHTILRSNMELMEVLGSAIAKRDSDTNSHNYRVTLYAVRLAEKTGLAKHRIKELIAGAFLHDVGKIGIQDAILHKPGKLDEAEYLAIQQHVQLGLDIISHSAWLRHSSDVVGGHHEWFNGQGYPQGLVGDAIPVTARIFAIADVFDALTSRRPYKEPFSLDDSLTIMQQQSGSHFDPELLDAFMSLAPELHQRFHQIHDQALTHELREVVLKYWNGHEDNGAGSVRKGSRLLGYFMLLPTQRKKTG